MSFKRTPTIDRSVLKDIEKILDSGILSGYRGTKEGNDGGEYVQYLERTFKGYFRVKYAIALNSATAGLYASLVALRIGKGDKVLVTPYSFVSSASCVLMAGAKPVFIDIEPDYFNMDTNILYDIDMTNVKAIIPVHLHGHPANMHNLMTVAKKYGLKVIEDAAQAITAKIGNQYVGTIGDCGVFSFNQSKHISTGEGGMVLTNSDEIAERIKAVRNHGEISNPSLGIVGYNFRMCEIEAALALSQFRKIDEQVDRRIELANYLTGKLQGVGGIIPPKVHKDCKHVYYTYSIKCDDRERVLSKLNENEIYFGRYVTPIYDLPAFEKADCPVVEDISRSVLVTDTIRPPATFDDMDRIAEAIR